MSKDNFKVGLVKYACPICGKETDNAIIMNSRFTKKDAKAIEDANNKFIGYSNNACKECLSHKDECIYVIEIDAEKSEPNNPYRTGYYWGLVKDFPLFVEHPEFLLKTENDVQFCFMNKEFAKQIGLPYENN